MKKISVVMTTYNGEKYVREQLDSLVRQTMQPDEVLIFDDCSTDGTAELISRFIEEIRPDGWKLHVNAENLGWKRNFIRAMEAAEGEYVFLCDQDDIWRPDKIRDMVSVMEEDPSILLLAGNSNIIYTETEKAEHRPFYSFRERAFNLEHVWNNTGWAARVNKALKEPKPDTGLVRKIPFDTRLFSTQRQGCVMAMRREAMREALRFWEESCPHDTLLWFYAAVHDGLYLLEKHVIDYRHHLSNTGFNVTLGQNLTARSELQKIEAQKARLISLLPVLKNSTVRDREDKKEVLRKIWDQYVQRQRFLKYRRPSDGVAVIRQGGGKRQILFDWLLAYFT